jgi:hypothetical protein
MWGMEWIELAQDRYRWRALVTALMNLRGSIKCGEFFWLAENQLSFQERLLNAVSNIRTESRPATECIETAMNKLIFVRWTIVDCVRWTIVDCVRDWRRWDLWEWRQRRSGSWRRIFTADDPGMLPVGVSSIPVYCNTPAHCTSSSEFSSESCSCFVNKE